MYYININNYFSILDWSTLCWGIKNDIIHFKCAIDFANEIIKTNLIENEQLIIELLLLENANKEDVLSIISKLETMDDMSVEDVSKKLKYIILSDIMCKKRSIKAILDATEELYGIFGYPEDMNSFIRYMPIETTEYNPAEHTRNENENHLVQNILDYLKNENEKYIGMK